MIISCFIVRNTPHTATLNSTLDDLMKNKGGIEINPFFPIKEKIEKHNTCEKIYQVLNKGRIARKIQHVQVVDKHGKKPSIISLPSNAAVIEPNCKIDITIRVSPSSVGTFDYILVARFEGFDIGRKICLEVNDHISRDNTATSRYIQELPLRLPPPNEVYDKKSQRFNELSLSPLFFQTQKQTKTKTKLLIKFSNF